LKNWKKQYEDKYSVEFYKGIITKSEQKIKTQFNIKIEDIPAFVFIRNKAILERIVNLDEANPEMPSQATSTEETKDEQQVKQMLDKLCKSP
jgi:hypothetical protein